ncbi:MAG: phosphotransferase [Gammaproteobacteria bacterium]
MAQMIEILPPEAVTADWLTGALACRGIEAKVARFDIETVGTGQLGETRRFYLTYAATPPPNAPKSVVGKFHAASGVARESGHSMGFYRAEVMFYRELAPRARLRVPHTYVAEIDPKTSEFVLLFEDLAPGIPGDQMRGCSLDQARAALSEAAMLHAAFWNDRELMNQDWVYVPEGAQGFYTTGLIEESWAYFKRTYDGWLTREVVDVCERYVRNHAYWNRPREFPKCFSHCDFRSDNMLFRDGARVAIVDWQTSNFLGTGMDVAYFLGGAFDRETRRAEERALLEQYHRDLNAHGVKDYSFDHLMADYRHYSFAVLAVAIAATVIVKRTERGDRLFMHMITGGAHQALDNHALDLLPA